MSYILTLTEHELDTLSFLAARGYFPSELYNHLTAELGEQSEANQQHNKHTSEYSIVIPEHVAWSLTELRELDSDAYLACLGGSLKERINILESQIV